MKDRRTHARQLLESLAKINPYHTKDLAYLWATGYLAGLLGRIMEQDPLLAKEIERQFADALKREQLSKFKN